MGEHFARRGESGIYYARLRVPADLVETVGRKEVTKSLGTTDRREAKKLTREWIDRQESEFERLRRTRELTETDLKAIAVEHYISELEFEERMKALKPSLVGLKVTPPASPVQSRPEEMELDRLIRGTNEPFDVPDPRVGREWEADGRKVRLAALQEHIAQDNFALIEWAVDAFISARGLSVERDTPDYLRLCHRLMRAEIEVVRRMIERDSGNYGGTPADPLLADTSISLDTSTFEEIIKRQEVRSKTGINGRIAPSTLQKYRTQIGEFTKWRGSNRVATITVEELERWRDELLESNSRKTVKDKISTVRAVANWGQKQSKGKLFRGGVPLEHLDLPIVENNDSAKMTYTVEQAKAILTAARQSTENHKRWLPFLMAYSGARISELVALDKQDFFCVEGAWFYILRVKGEERTTKTMKVRRIPVHPALIEEGLLEFVESAPPGKLFPERRCAQNVRDWIRKDVSKPDGRNHPAPCHGFRHLFEDLRLEHMSQEAANYITGRANRGSDRLYGKSEAMLPGLAAEMRKFPKIL